jgi:hypothetical protein
VPIYYFNVTAHYVTDGIEAESEEEARSIANKQLQYCGEERDTEFELRDVEEI